MRCVPEDSQPVRALGRQRWRVKKSPFQDFVVCKRKQCKDVVVEVRAQFEHLLLRSLVATETFS